MAELKLQSFQRPDFFIGKLLQEKDFPAEQAYDLNRVRDHVRALHTLGIGQGLELESTDHQYYNYRGCSHSGVRRRAAGRRRDCCRVGLRSAGQQRRYRQN